MSPILFPIFALIVAAGLFFTYIDPTYGKIQERKVEVNRLDEALIKAKEVVRLREELRAKYEAFSQEDLERLRKLLPDNIDNIRFILDVNTIAKAYGLQIREIDFSVERDPALDTQQPLLNPDGTVSTQPQAPSSPYGTVVMEFEVNASYEDFFGFERDLERSLRIADVSSIQVEQAENSSLYTYIVTVKTHWLR